MPDEFSFLLPAAKPVKTRMGVDEAIALDKFTQADCSGGAP
jgi:hypothetical protein